VRFTTAAPLLLAGLLLCAVAASPGSLASLSDLSANGDEAFEGIQILGGTLALVGAPLVLAGAIAFVPRLRVRSWMATVGAGFALAGALYALAIVPRMNPVKSAREVALWVAARPEKPTAIPCLGVKPEGYRFYAGIPAVTGELIPALEREGASFLGLVGSKAWSRMSEPDRARFQILREQGVGGRDVIVLGAAGAGR
jgi:hypothetical protein